MGAGLDVAAARRQTEQVVHEAGADGNLELVRFAVSLQVPVNAAAPTVRAALQDGRTIAVAVLRGASFAHVPRASCLVFRLDCVLDLVHTLAMSIIFCTLPDLLRLCQSAIASMA